MRRLITLLVMVTLAATAGVIAPRPARGCSCMEIDPYAALGEFPAAFVGTLVDIDGQQGPIFQSDADTVYRFEVETWVKGDLGEVVDVHSAADGASCGIEVGVGGRLGVFVRVEGGEYHSSLCANIDADILLAAAEPLKIGAPGPARLLVSGNIGGYGLLAVNDTGGIVAALPGDGQGPYDRPRRFARCPESDLLVEVWPERIVIRDLSDLSVLRSVTTESGQTAISDIRCFDPEAERLWAAGETWSEGTGTATTSIFEVTPGGLAVIASLPPGSISLGDTFAVVSDHSYEKVSIYDYQSGETTLLHEANRADDTYVGIPSASISPDATRIAVLEVTYHDPTPTNQLTIYSPDGTEIAQTEIGAEGWWLEWIDNERLMVFTANPDYTDSTGVVLSATAGLSTIVELEGWRGHSIVVDGNTIYGHEGGTLVKGDAVSGEVTELITFPTQYLGPIAVLPATFVGTVEEEPAISDEMTPAPPPGTVPPAIVETSALDELTNAGGSIQIMAGIAAIIAFLGLGVALIARSRRQHEERAAGTP